MSIEKIDADTRLPFEEDVLLGGDQQKITEYFFDLVETLQSILDNVIVAANFSLDLTDGDAVYYALKDANDNYPVGTWRRIQVGDNLEDQVLLGGDSTTGTWTMAQTRERPE